MSLLLILAWLALTTGLLGLTWAPRWGVGPLSPRPSFPQSWGKERDDPARGREKGGQRQALSDVSLLCRSAAARVRTIAFESTPLRLALLTAVVRLIPALLLKLPQSSLVQWDIDSYHTVARLFLAGRDIYASGRYPYLPLQVYPLAAAQWLNAHAGLPFLPLVKAPAILADAGTTALLWRAAGRHGFGHAARARIALLFALNPLSITVTALHGQFDAISLFLTFAAWSVVDGCRAGSLQSRGVGRWVTAPSFVRLTTHDSRLTLLAGLLLGLGIADKSWPAILLPVLFFMLQGRQTRLLFLAGAAAPVVVSLAAYALLIRVGPLHPLQEAVSYRAFTGVWGLSLLATKLQLVWPGVAPVAHFLELHGDSVDLLAAFAAAFWLRRTPGRERNCLAVILVAFAAASGWGFHWLVWVLPFAALASERRARLYTALGACQYVLIYFVFGGVAWGFTYLTSSLAVLRYTWLLSLPLWLFIVAWAGAEIRGLATSADHEGSIREIPGSLSKSVSRV